MRIVHPEALDGVGGECPDRVGIGGEDYECGDGEPFEVERSRASMLASQYGVEVADIAVEEETDSDPTDGSEDETDEPVGTCEVVKGDGEVCGRELPCQYHDE